MSIKTKKAAMMKAARARKSARELKQLRESEVRLKEEVRLAMRRALNAERSTRDMQRSVRVLPKEFMEQIIARMVARMVREMGAEAYKPLVDEFLRRTIVRFDRRYGQGVEVMVDNRYLHEKDEVPQVTVSIPSFHITQILDEGYLESLGIGGRGITVMEDKPINMISTMGAVDYDRSPTDRAVKYDVERF